MIAKKYDYFWAIEITEITGIVFVSQLVIEVSGIAQRKSGFEWVIYACGAAFACSLLYSAALILMNAMHVRDSAQRMNSAAAEGGRMELRVSRLPADAVENACCSHLEKANRQWKQGADGRVT
jgi:hypothetical protein